MTREQIAIVVALIGCGVVAGSCAGLAESSYTAEQARCVDQARTLEESRACRARVDQRWHVERDGAAP